MGQRGRKRALGSPTKSKCYYKDCETKKDVKNVTRALRLPKEEANLEKCKTVRSNVHELRFCSQKCRAKCKKTKNRGPVRGPASLDHVQIVSLYRALRDIQPWCALHDIQIHMGWDWRKSQHSLSSPLPSYKDRIASLLKVRRIVQHLILGIPQVQSRTAVVIAIQLYTLEAEHLQLAGRHARLYSLHSLSSPRSPGQSPVPHISTSSPPTPKFARRTPPHLEHLQPAARHARLYSLHSRPASAPPTPKFAPRTPPDLGSRTPAASSQACRAIPDLGSRTPAASSQACQAIQPAQPVQPTQPRPVTVPDMSSSAPTPKFAPQTSRDLRSRTPAASSQACQAIQPAQPVQPTQPRPVTVPDMSSSAPTPKFAPQTSPDLGSRTPAASSQACQAIQPAQPVQPTQPRPVTVPHISTSSPPTPKFAPRTPPHLGSRTPAASSQACQAIQPAQLVQPTQPSQCSTNSQICTSNLTRPRKPNTCS